MLKRKILGTERFGYISEKVFKDSYKFDVFIDIEDIKDFEIGTIKNKHTVLINYLSDYYQFFIFDEVEKIHKLANY